MKTTADGMKHIVINNNLEREQLARWAYIDFANAMRSYRAATTPDQISAHRLNVMRHAETLFELLEGLEDE